MPFINYLRKMKRKFLTNLVLVIFLNLLIKPFWVFGVDRTVQNIVGAGTYGFYFSLYSFSLVLNIILDVGMTNFNNRGIARNPNLLGNYLSNIIVLKFILALAYALVCVATGIIIGYDAVQFRLLIVLIFNQVLASLILYFRSNLSGLHLFPTDSMLSVLDRSLAVIFCSLLIWGKVTDAPFRIEWFVYSQTLAYGITALVAFFIVSGKARFSFSRISRGTMKQILVYSYPFAVLILLMSFYYRIDSVMLERMLPRGMEQAGIYAQSFRILDAAGMFAFLFSGLLLPIFSRMLKKNESVGGMVHLSYTLIYIPAILLAVASLFYGREILEWLYNEHIATSARIFPVLMFGFVAISTTYIFGTLLTANGNLRELNILSLSAVFLNILLNLIFIPRMQAFGAALASLITQAYMAFSQVIISVRKLRIPFNPSFLVILFLYSGGLFLVARITKEFISNWLASALAFVVSGMLIAFAIRLLKFRSLIILFFRNEKGS